MGFYGKAFFVLFLCYSFANADFNASKDVTFTLTTDKKSLYFGESFNVKTVLKISNKLNVYDIKEQNPYFENFILKAQPTSQKIKNDDYTKYEKVYHLSPKTQGIKNIDNASAILILKNEKKGVYGAINSVYEQETIKSNSLKIFIKPLPDGLKLIGKFDIFAKVDKNQTTSKENINLLITIKGEGNFENILPFDAKIKLVKTFSDEPEIKKEKTKIVWTQKIAFASLEDFTIPSFKLRYFSKNKISTVKTNPIFIKIKKIKQKSDKPNLIMHKKEEEKSNFQYEYFLFFIGLILGFLLSKIKKPKKIKIFKTQKDLLQNLLPYKEKDKKLDLWIEKIEQNIYEKKSNKIDKNEIIKIIEKLQN